MFIPMIVSKSCPLEKLTYPGGRLLQAVMVSRSRRDAFTAHFTLITMSRQQQQREREDVPRISVDTLHDWERVKASYTDAAMSELEERMNGGKEGGGTRSEGEKEILRAHLRKVRT